MTGNYIVSQLVLWDINFPGGTGNDNIKWRALIWILSEASLAISATMSFLPGQRRYPSADRRSHLLRIAARWYSRVFRISLLLLVVDFFLCLIWLPIGVSRTYGFRSAKDVFTMTCKQRLRLRRITRPVDMHECALQTTVQALQRAGIGCYHCKQMSTSDGYGSFRPYMFLSASSLPQFSSDSTLLGISPRRLKTQGK